MSHRATSRFWRLLERLSPELQKLARENFALLKSDPRHPSLRLKRVGKYWSARIGSSHRVLGLDSPAGIAWFWIGPHEEYLRIIKES